MTTIEETEQQTAIRERFDQQEAQLKAIEKEVAKLRVWFASHPEIGPFQWSASGNSIYFYSHYTENKDPKAIARTFGKDGWKRVKDSYTCGALHWEKIVDGVLLKIHGAEKVNYTPIEDVKL